MLRKRMLTFFFRSKTSPVLFDGAILWHARCFHETVLRCYIRLKCKLGFHDRATARRSKKNFNQQWRQLVCHKTVALNK